MARMHITPNTLTPACFKRVNTLCVWQLLFSDNFQFFMCANKELKLAPLRGVQSPWSQCHLAPDLFCVFVRVTDQSDGVLRPQHSEHGLKMFLEVTWIVKIATSSFGFSFFWTTIAFFAFKGWHNTHVITLQHVFQCIHTRDSSRT